MRNVHRSLAAVMIAAATMIAGAVAVNADPAGFVPPRFINQVKPQYPDAARTAGEVGEVKVKVLVQKTGEATSFSIFKSSGHKDLDDAVLDAVKKSTYRPAYSNGSPTLAFFDITYRFTLQGLAEGESSQSDLEAKLSANPSDAGTRKTLATVLINKGQYAQAEDVLVKGTQLDPNNAKFWSLLGFAYYSDGIQNKSDDKFKSGALAYDKAFAIDPKPDSTTLTGAALAYGRYAFALLQVQKAADALPYAQKAVKLDPKQVQYQIELGEALQGTGDNTGAIAAFKTAQQLDDKKSANVTARIYADMGVSLLSTNQEAEGIAAINQAEKIAPNSPVGYQALASYYIRNDKLDAALVPLQQLAQVSPTDAAVQVDIGDIYVQKKDFPKAKAAYDRALALDPHNANALFGAAQIAAAQNDLPGTSAALAQAIAASPKNAAPYNATIAVILLSLPGGKGADPINDIIKYSTAATTADPNYPNGWFDLGVAYARQGKKDDANTALRKAFDLFKAQNNPAGMSSVNSNYKALNNSDIPGYKP